MAQASVGLTCALRADMATATADPPAAASGRSNGQHQDRRSQFLDVFAQLKAEILADEKLRQADASAWMDRMLEYNVPGGKLNRGLSVRDTLLAIKPDAPQADCVNADRLGWAIELLQVRSLTTAATQTCAQPSQHVALSPSRSVSRTMFSYSHS